MLSALDVALFEQLNGRARSAALDVVLPLFSDAWLLWVGAVLFLCGYAWHCRRAYGKILGRVMVPVLLLGLSVGVADMSCNMIKDAVGRHRPFQTVAGTHFFTPDRQWTVVDEPFYSPGTTGGSFPSSHAATSMAVALTVALLFRRSRPWIFALPLLVGWSRIYVGKHFPVDVLAGWCVGMLVALVVWRGCRLLLMRFLGK